MAIKSINLAWIVVKDLKSALKFYTESVGLKLIELHEHYGWAELSGTENGTRLGIVQQSDREPIKPGQNAIVTLTVENLTDAIAELSKKGVKMQGEVLEIPGIVKLQMIVDADNNHFQLVECLSPQF